MQALNRKHITQTVSKTSISKIFYWKGCIKSTKDSYQCGWRKSPFRAGDPGAAFGAVCLSLQKIKVHIQKKEEALEREEN